MSKLLTLIVSFSIIFFTACSSKNATPDAKNASGLEGKDVSAFLIGTYVDEESAKTKLVGAGFEILASYDSVKNGTTVVVTNTALKAEAVKPGRAHAAIIRIFIDKQEKIISITNPIYFGKAYMQDEYNHTVFNTQLESINKAFPGLIDSADKMKFDDLSGYHFMIGMPYYQDVDELATGKCTDLITKAKAYKKGKLLVYELKLSETSTLLGYDLGKRTKKFVKKIGRANAAILPYSISIENGKATSLEAKYYIALNYPLLTMTTFTTIATVPGAIAKDLAKVFK